ncbi:Acetyl-coenzyme A carboxylase carboxyl transferase subunit beta, partial [Dissostichus eleginoides]
QYVSTSSSHPERSGLITVSDGVYSSCSPTNVILTNQLERQQLVCVAQWSMTLVLSKPDPAPAPSPPAENCGSIATARCCLGRQHLWEDMS